MSWQDVVLGSGITLGGGFGAWALKSYIRQIAGPRGPKGEPGDKGPIGDVGNMSVRNFQNLSGLLANDLIIKFNGRYPLAEDVKNEFKALNIKIDAVTAKLSRLLNEE